MPTIIYVVFCCLTLVLAGCSANTANNERETLSELNVNTYALNKLVCDPFDPGSPGLNDGLKADLYYRGQGHSRWRDVQSYIDQGIKSEQHVFFTTLEVPTRKFNLGFPTETGASIENDSGEVLHEYFALRFHSVLKLTEEQAEGYYQLALLSDDGAILRVRNEEGVYQTYVDNDGDHPTRMGCGETIHMTQGKEVIVQLDYYQGPRYHISLIPIWRKVDSAAAGNDPLCGRQGNSLFFDFNNNSQPQQAYHDLLDRGWQPIAASNWNLPASSIFNPCTNGDPAVISDLQVVDYYDGLAVVSWQTDVPATSQVLYTDLDTGIETLTKSDNLLRTGHSITLTDLIPGHTYEIQAVSITASFGKTISPKYTMTAE